MHDPDRPARELRMPLAAAFALSILRRQWTPRVSHPEADRHLSSLLLHLVLLHHSGMLPTKTQAARMMGMEYGRTAILYFQAAEQAGLIRFVASRRDKRKSYVCPTDKALARLYTSLEGLIEFIYDSATTLVGTQSDRPSGAAHQLFDAAMQYLGVTDAFGRDDLEQEMDRQIGPPPYSTSDLFERLEFAHIRYLEDMIDIFPEKTELKERIQQIRNLPKPT